MSNANDSSTLPSPPSEMHQFDFWLGEWQVSWGDGATGTNWVRSILGGFAVLENFDGRSGTPLQGMSVSTYDPLARRWHQTWADNTGGYYDLTGGMEGDRMILTTTDRSSEQQALLRMTFADIQPDQFDWTWERSQDQGETWHPLWKIHYTRLASRA